MYQTALYYLRWYQNYFLDCWNHMTPSEYGTLLITIGLFGWLLMKNSVRR